MSYYLITGRVIGDDEDSAAVYEARSENEARGSFLAEMDPDDNYEVVINVVAISETVIRIHQQAPT